MSRVFEDFTSQPMPSRKVCLAGVEAAEVYVLLLGPNYGHPMPDTGVAPTEEEFTVARRRGMPTIVFKKNNVVPDERQKAFIKQVGDYQQGRFWKAFNSTDDLGIAVLDALRELGQQAVPLRYDPITNAVAVRWRADRRPPVGNSRSFDIHEPRLELHLATAGAPVVPVGALESRARHLGKIGRDLDLFPDSAALTIDSDTSGAWALAQLADDHRGGAVNGLRRGGPRGIALDRSGSVLVFETLKRDWLGSLVDQPYLTDRLVQLIHVAATVLSAEAPTVVPAAAIDPIGQVMEGDPSELGRRSSGSMRMTQNEPVRTEPDFQIDMRALPSGVRELASELSARLIAGCARDGGSRSLSVTMRVHDCPECGERRGHIGAERLGPATDRAKASSVDAKALEVSAYWCTCRAAYGRTCRRQRGAARYGGAVVVVVREGADGSDVAVDPGGAGLWSRRGLLAAAGADLRRGAVAFLRAARLGGRCRVRAVGPGPPSPVHLCRRP
jgi:Domain of unknown function (DUF4062)